jgi:hypothetical protein
MAKHKHEGMIIEWAKNTDLVLLFNAGDNWIETRSPSWHVGWVYFICLPKHQKAVMALLNGGKAEVLIKSKSNPEPYWSNCGLPTSKEWENNWWYMSNDVESRVKPGKQTRYAYMGPGGLLTPSYDNADDLDKDHSEAASSDEYQLITFEIEL